MQKIIEARREENEHIFEGGACLLPPTKRQRLIEGRRRARAQSPKQKQCSGNHEAQESRLLLRIGNSLSAESSGGDQEVPSSIGALRKFVSSTCVAPFWLPQCASLVPILFCSTRTGRRERKKLWTSRSRNCSSRRNRSLRNVVFRSR
jgi:hypothetical protein